jgi:hypothetical protein
MYTYLFLQTPSQPLELPPGILSPLDLVGNENLSAVVEPGLALGTIEQEDTQLLQAVLSHDRVIQRLFQQVPVLPLCFGTCFQGQDALMTHINQYQDFYSQQLDRLQGKAEYTLKGCPLELTSELDTTAPKPSDDPPVEPSRGRDYFLAKKQQYLQQSDRRSQQQTQWETLVAAIQRAYPDALYQPGEERLHLLVSHVRFPHLQKQLAQWQTQAFYWELNLSEPLPPYHFVQPPSP